MSNGTTRPPTQPCLYPHCAALAAQSYVQNDEIDLLEFWWMIWKRRWLIIGVAITAAVLAAAYSLTLPNVYQASVIVAPVDVGKVKAMSLGGLGGLASMAGISLGGSSGNSEINLAVLNSREFLLKFVKENKLKPILFSDAWDVDAKRWKVADPSGQPSDWSAFRTLQGIISTSSNKKSGLITVTITWSDAEIAAKWANELVTRLNAHLRQEALERSKKTLGYLNVELSNVKIAEMRQALFGLISQEHKKSMLANTQKEYAFRVLDSAVAPDRRVKPQRRRIVIVVSVFTTILTIIFVIIQSIISSRSEYVSRGVKET